MSKRKVIPPKTVTQIVVESARRCALCFGFDGDLGRKKGQIAHADQDRSNVAEANLVYLCLGHHDEYDSTTSQSKGVTKEELLEHKRRLVEALANERHVESEAARNSENEKRNAIRSHDERLFRESDALMPERFLREFIEQLQSDDSYYWSKRRLVDRFRDFFAETGNRYMSDDIFCKLCSLVSAIDSLIAFLAQNFFTYPRQQKDSEDPRQCLHPELNIDRGGSGGPEEMARYDQLQEQLDILAEAATTKYGDYRLAVKSALMQ